MAVPSPLPWGKYVLLYVRYLFLEYSCSSYKYHQCYKMIRTCTVNHQSYLLLKSVLIRFCSGNVCGSYRFQQEMQYDQGVFVFKVYAMQFLMWLLLRYNSKLAKNISLFLNPYPFIQNRLLKSVVHLYLRNYFYPKICINDICM